MLVKEMHRDDCPLEDEKIAHQGGLLADETTDDREDDLSVDLRDDRYLTVKEAAKYLGLGKSKLYDLMEAGELKYAKFGRARRISVKELKAFAAYCTVGV